MALYDVSTSEKKASPSLVAGGTLYADSPIGTIVPFGGLDDKIPSGWLKCNGLAISRTTYAELFAVIGESFGAGDGSTTFNIPDLRETVPVGYGLNTENSSIADHDAYSIGEFKDDQLQNHTHKEFVDQAAGNVISVKGVSANANEDVLFTGNIKTGRKGTTTHGKQLGVNYIIKAKMAALPADFLAKVQPKTLDTPLTIGGVSRTTVEGALGAINNSIYQRYAKNFSTTHDRYVEIGTIPYSAQNTIYSFTTDIVIFSGGERGSIHLDVMSRAQTLTIQGWSDYNLAQTLSTRARIVASLENNETYHIYVDSDYQYLQINMYVRGSNFTAVNFIPSASITGTEVFNSTTNDSIQYLQKLSNKADKVTNATNGNLASLDANGNLVDSGIYKNYALRRLPNPTTAVDCNDLIDPFTEYRVGGGDANRPTTDTAGYILRTLRTSDVSTTYSQIACQIGGTNVYRRYFNTTTSTWSSWEKLITKSDITSSVTSGNTAPVSSGGVYTYVDTMLTQALTGSY